ncbi:MAG: hypothetical protein IPM57_07420 [Oligoflexia bacterium]|nr:hypothetical protein [Oligoflexia bacterium]
MFSLFATSPTLTWHFSSVKDSQLRAAVVLIHNFGGSQDQFSKHIGLFNNLGFDVVSFDLSWHKNGKHRIFFKRLRSAWAEEIESAFREILKTRVQIIPFTFSGIGVCTIDAAINILKAKRDVANVAIQKMIFDSGPFDHTEKCVDNMLYHYYEIKNSLLRDAMTKFMTFNWDPQNSETTIKRFGQLNEIYPDMSVLSLQGKLDKIVPYEFIQSCFNRSGLKNVTQVLFDTGGHLTSLKEEPEKYKNVVTTFLGC